MGDASAQWVVRDARGEDVPRLGCVHVAAWRTAYRGIISDEYLAGLDVRTFEGYHRTRFDEQGQLLPGEAFIVACDAAGEVIGFARGGPMRTKSATGDPLPASIAGRFTSELYAIYLLSEHIGRGVGYAMFDAIVRRLIDAGHESMCVWVLEANTLGRRFYERMGGELLDCESKVKLGGVTYRHIAYGWGRERARGIAECRLPIAE